MGGSPDPSRPVDRVPESLARLSQNLYAKTGVPASQELHAQVWLSPDPLQETEAFDALRDDDGELPGILMSGKASRRERSRWYEKALLTYAPPFNRLSRVRQTPIAAWGMRTTHPARCRLWPPRSRLSRQFATPRDARPSSGTPIKQ